MFALLLCVPLLALQGGGPALPQSLAEQPEAVQAWATLGDAKAEPAAKSAAEGILLEQLATLAPADRLAFLMEAEGAELLSNLRPTYRAMAKEWPALETRILETLVLPAGQNDVLLRGAIHAAGDLATSNAALLEQLASLLEAPQFHSDASRALYSLTRKEFGNPKDFHQWWATAKERGREAWLEDAAEASYQRELDDWRRRLQNGGQPAEILEGVVHPLQQVRSLAYVALRGLDLAGLDEATRGQVALALRNALQQESDAQLRIELLVLVPQVLDSREALKPLLHALEYGVPVEREAAARYLQFLPDEIAWEGILRGIQGAYPAATEGPSGPVPVRLALWSGLGTLISRGPAADPAALELQMMAALSTENEPAVRDYILSAVGRFGSASFLEILHPIVTDVEGAEADRSDALVAMTDIVLALGDGAQLLPLLTAMLDDLKPQVRLRTIESLGRLGLQEGPALLVNRLPLEMESVLQKKILGILAAKPYPEVVEALVAFQPTNGVNESYGRALVAQVGEDFETLKVVHEAMAQRGSIDFAFQVVRNFPSDGLSPEQAAAKERIYARAVSERLLVVGVENGNAIYADDAVTLLRRLKEAEPESLDWPIYLVELLLMREEVAPALAIMQELADDSDMTNKALWGLGLDVLRFAAASKLIEPGQDLLESLRKKGPYPPAMQFTAEQVLENFPPREPEAVLPPKTPETDASKGEAPASGEEAPEASEDGGASKPETGAGQDPGPTAEGGSEEPPKMVSEPL
ncbi:MAG: HEAT repeat domain-containing protein [Planctomycetota bacterium]